MTGVFQKKCRIAASYLKNSKDPKRRLWTPKRQAKFNCDHVDTKQPFDSLNQKKHMPLKTKKEGETKLFQDIGSMENTFESFRIRAELGALECDLESSGNKKTCSKTTI